MKLKDAFEEFLAELPGQSAENQRNYRHRLRLLLKSHGSRAASSLTRADVNAWHREMLKLEHSSATNAGYRQAMRAFASWLQRNEFLKKHVADHLAVGSYVPQVVKIPHEDDVETVTAVARRMIRENASYVSVRRGTLWLYAVESGCRLSGLYWLMLAEVQRGLSAPSGGFYKFASIEKGAPVVHSVGEEVAEALRKCLSLRPSGDRYFFVRTKPTVKRMTKGALTKDFVRICKGVVAKTIYVHTLRHRVGDGVTRKLSPKAAQKKLNHADVTTTLKWYHDANERDLEEATAIMSVPKRGNEADEMARLFGVYD